MHPVSGRLLYQRFHSTFNCDSMLCLCVCWFVFWPIRPSGTIFVACDDYVSAAHATGLLHAIVLLLFFGAQRTGPVMQNPQAQMA